MQPQVPHPHLTTNDENLAKIEKFYCPLKIKMIDTCSEKQVCFALIVERKVDRMIGIGIAIVEVVGSVIGLIIVAIDLEAEIQTVGWLHC